MSDSPTPDQTADETTESADQQPAESADQQPAESADQQPAESAPAADAEAQTSRAETGPADAATAEPATTTPEVQQVAGEAAQPTVGAGAGEDVVVMQDPGGSMTSTGDQIVEDDLGDEDFETALEGTLKSMSEGEIVEGVVVKIDPDEVLLDIGWKSEGVIPARELSIKLDVDPGEVVQVGDVVEALVMHSEDEQGRLVLSKKRAQYERAWGTIERIYHDDGTVIGTVIEVVKGGLILDIGLRGFLPASLVEMRRVRDLEPYVGTQLECKIIELDRNRNNVVLSRRKFLEETQSEFRQEFLQSLQKGEIRKGVVSSIVNFGAFVDLGGVDGLVHVSELSWHHIDHPSEVVEVGDEVEVEVLDVDMERERVSLSLKATQEDPWQKFAREHAVGEVVEGEVTKLVPFGSFVKVAEGIEGLVHISELADRHVEVPEAVVNVGEKVDVKVIDIDTVRRRISLSLKQAGPGGEETEDEYGEEPTVEHAYSSGGDEEPAGGTMAGALADAGLAPAGQDAPSPEEMALAEAELPDEVTSPAPSEDSETGAAVAPDEDAEDSTVETKDTSGAEDATDQTVAPEDAPTEETADEEPVTEPAPGASEDDVATEAEASDESDESDSSDDADESSDADATDVDATDADEDEDDEEE